MRGESDLCSSILISTHISQNAYEHDSLFCFHFDILVEEIMLTDSYFGFTSPNSIYPPAKVGGWQTYHAVCLAVPPDWIIEYSKNGNKIQKEY